MPEGLILKLQTKVAGVAGVRDFLYGEIRRSTEIYGGWQDIAKGFNFEAADKGFYEKIKTKVFSVLLRTSP